VATANDWKTASEDKSVKVWDSQSGQELLTLAGPTDAVSSAAISRDGRRIVSASADGTIRVWDGTPLSPNEFESVSGK